MCIIESKFECVIVLEYNGLEGLRLMGRVMARKNL